MQHTLGSVISTPHLQDTPQFVLFRHPGGGGGIFRNAVFASVRPYVQWGAWRETYCLGAFGLRRHKQHCAPNAFASCSRRAGSCRREATRRNTPHCGTLHCWVERPVGACKDLLRHLHARKFQPIWASGFAHGLGERTPGAPHVTYAAGHTKTDRTSAAVEPVPGWASRMSGRWTAS